ncbi:trimeric intracellular cation channel family protein [Bifidobacterium sp.]|uniref:trimeric intracellular cation channel family protein n=1 Tax=Bifidobacterium sp. TaxID=41200 RepID=UPI0025B8FFB6|nr:TRIC cation channel family protein [Bifidobacterium sp.]MCH4209861.1 TRIC cation channel family protein [Bifidobacterium sp.]MCI1224182.1 TRIC cation channel family protein [Bifidobacterium sp.]
MEPLLESNTVFMGIEYLAIFCCGLSGGLMAVRKGYDLFSILITSWLTALGGGIVRDVLLGIFPPAGISDRGLVLTALASSLVVAVIHPEVGKLKWTMLVIDALALGLFAVNGTSKALLYHTSGMTAVFLGMFTALAGGLFRDILLNEVPAVIKDRHWYAVPSFVGCVLTVLLTKALSAGLIDINVEMAGDIVIVGVVVAMRILSVVYNIQLPGAMQRHEAHLPPPLPLSQSRYLRRPVVHPQADDPTALRNVDAGARHTAGEDVNAGQRQRDPDHGGRPMSE